MYETLSRTTLFYRATNLGLKWTDVLSGKGAYFADGGRYHRHRQPTIYAADDPLVAISELAFYRAIDWQEQIGKGHDVYPFGLPLISVDRLWAFTLNDDFQIIDLTNPTARQTFSFHPFALSNPSRHYVTTQDIADAVLKYPDARHPLARGFKAPSVRTTPPLGGRADHLVLSPGARGLKAKEVGKCRVSIQFLDREGLPVTAQAHSIDWAHPRFRLNDPSIPMITTNSACRGGLPLEWDRWNEIAIRFA